VNATSIDLSDASIVFETPQNRLFGVSPGGTTSIAIVYGSPTAANVEPLSELATSFLQIGNLSLPGSDPWTFCLTSNGTNAGLSRCFGTDLVEIKSFVCSVADGGNFSIAASSISFRGFLVHADGSAIFEVQTIRTFVDEAYFSFFPRTESSIIAASTGVQATADLFDGLISGSVPLLPSSVVECPSGLLPTTVVLSPHASESPATPSVRSVRRLWLIAGFASLGTVAFFAARIALGVCLARGVRGRRSHQQGTIDEEQLPETLIGSQSDALTLSLLTPVPELGDRSGRARMPQGTQSPELWELSDDFDQNDNP
jgi:hypothetical protein